MAREVDSVYTTVSLLDALSASANEADGRKARGKRYPAAVIVVLLFLGYLAGNTSFRSIARFFAPNDPSGKEQMLRTLGALFPLPFGIPSYSTFSRVMADMDPVLLVCTVSDFIYQLAVHPDNCDPQLCIDGKALRAAVNKELTGKSLYIVNVFDAACHLFLYQICVGPKAQEGKAIEEQISDILLRDPATITMDAMGTKKAILDRICKAGSRAVLPVKSNNKNLMESIRSFVISYAFSGPDDVQSLVDLGDYSEEDIPSFVIRNTVCGVYEEDNRTEAPEEPKTVDTMAFLDRIFAYSTETSDDASFPLDCRNRQLAYVRVGDRFIPMVHTHGRYERREYLLISDPALIEKQQVLPAYEGWSNIHSVGCVTRYRGVEKRDPQSKARYLDVTVTCTPYILTDPMAVREFSDTCRNHWAVECGHNVLDECFKEDRSTVRGGSAPENCSLLRKLAYNVLSVIISQDTRRGVEYRKDKEGFTAVCERIRGNLSEAVNFIKKRVRIPFL